MNTIPTREYVIIELPSFTALSTLLKTALQSYCMVRMIQMSYAHRLGTLDYMSAHSERRCGHSRSKEQRRYNTCYKSVAYRMSHCTLSFVCTSDLNMVVPFLALEWLSSDFQ